MTPDLELHVDALVIDGLGDADGVRTADALTHELIRLLERAAGSPLPSRNRAIESVSTDARLRSPQPRPSELGVAVARAVHGELIR
jgi:hypothetical protein